MPELTIRATAAALGVSTDTVRRRIRRGTLTTRRDSRGWVLVMLPDSPGSAGPAQGYAAPSATDVLPSAVPYADAAHLHEEITYLRGALEREQVASAELRRLLQQSQQRLAAPVDAAASTVDSPLRASGRESDGAAATGSVWPLPRRRWWRFWR